MAFSLYDKYNGKTRKGENGLKKFYILTTPLKYGYKEKITNQYTYSGQWLKKAIEEITRVHVRVKSPNLQIAQAVRLKWGFQGPVNTLQMKLYTAYYKVQLVAQSFFPVHGMNLNKTYFLIMRLILFCIFLAIACSLWSYHGVLSWRQINIVRAYLENLLRDNNISIYIQIHTVVSFYLRYSTVLPHPASISIIPTSIDDP